MWCVIVAGALCAAACGESDGGVDVDNPLTDPTEGPPAGNAEGGCAIPAEAGPEDTSSPDHVVGTGSPESCTADAFIEAVAQGGVITFDCGPDPVTITVDPLPGARMTDSTPPSSPPSVVQTSTRTTSADVSRSHVTASSTLRLACTR